MNVLGIPGHFTPPPPALVICKRRFAVDMLSGARRIRRRHVASFRCAPFSPLFFFAQAFISSHHAIPTRYYAERRWPAATSAGKLADLWLSTLDDGFADFGLPAS